MQHYKVETKDNATLYTAYPHEGNVLALSLQDYFEDLFSQGWEFVAFSGTTYVFRANAQ